MKKDLKVGIVMGSDSENFKVSYEITVASAHRAPNLVHKYATEAKSRGFKVIIAGAGGAAHLAGVIASLTTLPIIGIPIKTKSLDGLDSILSTISMPPGIPVATVGINAGKNAGLLAVAILAISDKNLEKKLIAYKNKMSKEIKIKGEKLLKVGYKKYLKK